MGAVSAHKLVIAFCIGVELIATRTKTCLSVIYITTFAIVSPLGIGIGLILVGGEGATAAGVYSVVLQGLASGTLLYVIFFEIWKSDRTGILQYLAALIGFGLMFGLQLLSKCIICRIVCKIFININTKASQTVSENLFPIVRPVFVTLGVPTHR